MIILILICLIMIITFRNTHLAIIIIKVLKLLYFISNFSQVHLFFSVKPVSTFIIALVCLNKQVFLTYQTIFYISFLKKIDIPHNNIIFKLKYELLLWIVQGFYRTSQFILRLFFFSGLNKLNIQIFFSVWGTDFLPWAVFVLPLFA